MTVADRIRQVLGGPLVPVLVAIIASAMLVAYLSSDRAVALLTLRTAVFTGPGIAETLGRFTPILLLAIAAAYAVRAGVLNLGGQGQMTVGALAGTVAALHVPGPAPIAMPVVLLVAAGAGAVWALLSALLFTKLGVPIYISSLLLNYPAASLVSYLVRFPLKDPGTSQIASRAVDDRFDIPMLAPTDSSLGRAVSSVFGDVSPVGFALHSITVAPIVALLILIGYAVVCRLLPSGLEGDLIGRNARFAAYGGVDLASTTLRTMIWSGGVAGAVGVFVVLAGPGRLIDGEIAATNYAWTALLVALIAGSGAVSLLAVSLAFAAMIVTGEALQRATGISSQIANVMQAAVILIVALRVTLPTVRRRPTHRIIDRPARSTAEAQA